MSSRFDRAYRVKSDTTFDDKFWNRIMRDLDTRIVAVEEKKASFEEAEKTLLDLGLRRINETLLPAAERIQAVSDLGFLIASSDDEVAVAAGQTVSLTITAGPQRDLFTPSPFVALTRRSTVNDYAIARLVTYNRETGILVVQIDSVTGDPGPHDDWDVAALAGSVMAQVAALDQTIALRDEVAIDRAAVAVDREATQTARTTAEGARDAATTAKVGAENALASFMQVYRGALPSAPPDGEQGHFYFDTTLQMARVYTASGWGPLFQVSLGGIRQGFFEATNGQDDFTVPGGFSFLNVWVNGVLLTPGVDYTTASPDVTLAAPLSAGDQVAYTGYYATDVTDFYSKFDADARFVRFDGAQTLTPEQQAQALANLGIDPWAVQPIGLPIGLMEHIAGVSPPPTDRGYRYVKLTAGLSGAGGYNQGVLTSESVSGSAPYINATAVVNFAGSPINGQTIPLLNTEGRFLRAGPTSGALQDDTLKSHTHTAAGRIAQDGHSGPTFASAPGNGGPTSPVTNATGDTETRPRNIAVPLYMRIK